MEAELIDYKLTGDRQDLYMRWNVNNGLLEQHLGFDHPIDDDWVQHCLDISRKSLNNNEKAYTAGERVTGKMIGPFFLMTNVGPPIWWFPHFKLFKWGFGAGWYKACFELGLRGPRT